MSYRWEINEPPESQVNELRDAGEVSRVAALALSRLGITASRVAAYLRPMLSQLSDPYQLPGVEKAAERLWEAIRRQERILVYGDYDTDGITATVLVAEVLSANGAHVDCYLPHRIDDGYGLTAEAVERVCTAEQTVLLTVDCGITCAAAVEAANARGMDVIITDHHEPHEAIPEALAVIDPKLPDAPPVVQSLAGVGVAFKLCHGFIKYGRRHDLGGQDTDLRQFLDLVALGTVADIVPLLDENRCLVTAGLDVLSQQIRPGIRALCEVTNLRERVRTTDITFRIAPRINAAGRLGNPDEAFQLLHARDTTEAYQLAAALDGRNRERQQVEAQVLAAAEEQIAEIADIEQCHTVVVCGEEWHKGVIGIVASRLVRKYNRPSIVLTRDSDGALCGSGRSLHNLNLVTLLGVCEVHLQRFGGHAMAAGLALDPVNLPLFQRDFEAAVRRVVGAVPTSPALEVCGRVKLEELEERVFGEMEMFEPFGHSNPEPLFFCSGVVPDRVLPAGRSHSRGSLKDESGRSINFIYFGTPPDELPQPPWDMVFTPQLNRYNGSVRPQIRIHDLRPGMPEQKEAGDK